MPDNDVEIEEFMKVLDGLDNLQENDEGMVQKDSQEIPNSFTDKELDDFFDSFKDETVHHLLPAAEYIHTDKNKPTQFHESSISNWNSAPAQVYGTADLAPYKPPNEQFISRLQNLDFNTLFPGPRLDLTFMEDQTYPEEFQETTFVQEAETENTEPRFRKRGRPRMARVTLSNEHKKVVEALYSDADLLEVGRSILFWQFILYLLEHRNTQCLSDVGVHWVSRQQRIFKVSHSAMFAAMWSEYTHNRNTSYINMSRMLRYYYGQNILEKHPSLRLCYIFHERPMRWAQTNFEHY